MSPRGHPVRLSFITFCSKNNPAWPLSWKCGRCFGNLISLSASDLLVPSVLDPLGLASGKVPPLGSVLCQVAGVSFWFLVLVLFWETTSHSHWDNEESLELFQTNDREEHVRIRLSRGAGPSSVGKLMFPIWDSEQSAAERLISAWRQPWACGIFSS